jgi:hypothetical protein
MDGLALKGGRSERSRWHARTLATGLLAISLAGPASASPIRAVTHAATGHNTVLNEWAAFLAGGPAEWAAVHAPPITAAFKHEANLALNGSNPTSNPIVQYLEWRHNLDPARFDHWHPTLGPLLETLNTPTSSTAAPPATSIHPAPQLIPPLASTPEPSGITLGLALLGAGAWWRARANRAPRTPGP